MEKQDDFKIERVHQKQLSQEPNDLQIIFSLIVKNWYWFVLTIIIALFFVRFYIRHTLPVYSTSATVLINETEDNRFAGNAQILQGLGLPGGQSNLHNQIMILNSMSLTESTLRELQYEIEFYTKGLRN